MYQCHSQFHAKEKKRNWTKECKCLIFSIEETQRKEKGQNEAKQFSINVYTYHIVFMQSHSMHLMYVGNEIKCICRIVLNWREQRKKFRIWLRYTYEYIYRMCSTEFDLFFTLLDNVLEQHLCDSNNIVSDYNVLKFAYTSSTHIHISAKHNWQAVIIIIHNQLMAARCCYVYCIYPTIKKQPR